MALTTEQIKGRIRNLAKQNNADARIVLRMYMMERFLERVAVSAYVDNFIIKGGILVTSMVGIAMRSTMDIDTTIRNLNLSEENMISVINEIAQIDIGDDIKFSIKDVSNIMDDMDYPGIRILMDATIGKMPTPLKIDISTGDIITPRAVEYTYKLMLENRTINLWSYNLETILAEKLQTILVRGVLNTRMRDYYDIYMLLVGYSKQINVSVLKQAFHATCKKRESLQLETMGKEIIVTISADEVLKNLWTSYQKRFNYATEISFEEVVRSVRNLYYMVEEENY